MGNWRTATVRGNNEATQTYSVQFYGERYINTVPYRDVIRWSILGDPREVGRNTGMNFYRVTPTTMEARLDRISGRVPVIWCFDCERYYSNYLQHVNQAHPNPTLTKLVRKHPEILQRPKYLNQKERKQLRKDLRTFRTTKDDFMNDVSLVQRAVERVRNKRRADWEEDEDDDEENAPKRQRVDLNIGQPIDENDISYIGDEEEGAVGGAVGGADDGADDGAFGGPDDGATCSKYCR